MTEDACCFTVLLIFGILGYAVYYENQNNLHSIGDWQKHLSSETPKDSSNPKDEMETFGSEANTITDMLESAAKSSNFTDELDKDVKKAKNRKNPNKNTIPLEWKQLKEIYPEAEMKEYSDYDNFMNGNWDKEGLREDLELMIKRTGKTPKDSYSDDEDWGIINEETDFNKLTIYKLRDELKAIGLSASGNKKTLIKRLNTDLEEKKKERKKDETPEIANNEDERKGEVVALLEPVGKKIKKRKSHKTKMEEIKELGEMMNNGLITQEEFEGLKKDIMKDEE